MKLPFALALITLSLYGAQTPQMPPMPPQLPTAQAPVTDAECATVPPMLYMLPPPLQNALDACQNKRSLPTKEVLSKTLSTKKTPAVIVSVVPLEGFAKAYEVNATVGKKRLRFVCNATGERCLPLK